MISSQKARESSGLVAEQAKNSPIVIRSFRFVCNVDTLCVENYTTCFQNPFLLEGNLSEFEPQMKKKIGTYFLWGKTC